MIDEARAEYDDLQYLVRGVILNGFTTINNVVYDIFMYRNNMLEQSRIDFRQERETCSATVETLKGLGESAGVDVTACTDSAQSLLTALTSTLEDRLLECLVFTNVEATVIQNDARYYMDTLMTEVEIFDFQLKVCGEDFLCIEPILTQILEAKITIVQRIGVELDKANDLGEDLKVLIKQCADDKKSQSVAESGNVVSDATDCVNKLLP